MQAIILEKVWGYSFGKRLTPCPSDWFKMMLSFVSYRFTLQLNLTKYKSLIYPINTVLEL